MKDYPRFAVVGHPNKGKSSIVSTLAQDESVQISSKPGTTTKYRSFPLKVDAEILYELYDTPGFQRARAVLAWLKQEEVPANQKADRVKRFVYEHRADPRFEDEVELLEPILDGAGIIYVVDGSKPYGVEYEAEMEILRWTGEPSMALINLIDETDYVEEWRGALGQYFRMVRVFNPMQANFSQHISLLESMAQLKEGWTASVKQSIEIFTDYREEKIADSSGLIAQLIADTITHITSLPIEEQEATDAQREEVMKRYKKDIRKIEESAHRAIAKIWNHTRLEKEATPPLFDDIDLFSKESISLFGLSKKEMIFTGATGGALSGSGIDLMLGGSSLMMGSAIGAIIGGAGAMFGFDEIEQMEILGQSLGSRRIEIGPMKNRNFPYVLLRRALFFTQEIANRPHANRGKIRMDDIELLSSQWITAEQKKILQKIHESFASGSVVNKREYDSYSRAVESILREKIEH